MRSFHGMAGLCHKPGYTTLLISAYNPYSHHLRYVYSISLVNVLNSCSSAFISWYFSPPFWFLYLFDSFAIKSIFYSPPGLPTTIANGCTFSVTTHPANDCSVPMCVTVGRMTAMTYPDIISTISSDRLSIIRLHIQTPGYRRKDVAIKFSGVIAIQYCYFCRKGTISADYCSVRNIIKWKTAP